MVVKWRNAEVNRLGEIDLRQFDNDRLVIHFGGELHSVDAYTFANSLISFADTVRAVNEVINPGQKIDVRLEALGKGSFRALVTNAKKGLGGLFSSAPSNLFWIVATLILEGQYEKLTETKNETIVTDDSIILIRGGEKIIIPKSGANDYENSKNSPKVMDGIRRTFRSIEKDEAIENFGVTPNIDDEEPLVQIAKKDFEYMSSFPDAVETHERRRVQHKKDSVIVLKPWINASNKKWSFDWNGVPISAHVSDEGFLVKVKNHEVRFGNGDVIEVEFEFYQNFDEDRKIWETDKNSYSVVQVFAFWPKGGDRVAYDD